MIDFSKYSNFFDSFRKFDFTFSVIFPVDSDILVWSEIHERRNFCWYASLHCLISLICLLLSNNVQRLECSMRVRKVLKEWMHRKKRTRAFEHFFCHVPLKSVYLSKGTHSKHFTINFTTSRYFSFLKSLNVRNTLQSQPSFLFTDKRVIETCSS